VPPSCIPGDEARALLAVRLVDQRLVVRPGHRASRVEGAMPSVSAVTRPQGVGSPHDAVGGKRGSGGAAAP
jgi:hypothetical protein